jgi:hypothetical protein
MITPAHHRIVLFHTQIQIVGLRISDYSRYLLKEIAGEAHLRTVNVTSVRRTVEDQSRIFYQKHVTGKTPANYKNPAVAKIIAHARQLHEKGQSEEIVKAYLIASIEHIHGGPASISRHLGTYPFSEVFDVAHYSGPSKRGARHNYMTTEQACAFLEGCRRRMTYPIIRLGHSAELGFKLPGEFRDEKCFHFEVSLPIFDRLEETSGTMIA